jgi:phosphate uptake regulator
VGNIKRRLVKHGPSSYIVSLPLEWIKQHNLSKGDEVSVNSEGDNILVSASYQERFENAVININETKDMTAQIISALYKRGVDEIRINYSKPEQFHLILGAIDKEALGYEIIETSADSCTIKNITKLTKELQSVLRRVFLITLSLAEEGVKSIQEKKIDSLDNITILEHSNNKLTTFCRRYLNKYGPEDYDRLGPLYFIIETLEKIADEYKYLYDDLTELNGEKFNINPKILNSYMKINEMLRIFYECFYKFEMGRVHEIKKRRDEILAFLKENFRQLKNPADMCMYHHATTLVEKIYALVDPLLVLSIK